jgi:hypothetical protein
MRDSILRLGPFGKTASLAIVAAASVLLSSGSASAETLRELTSVQVVGNAPIATQFKAANAVGVKMVRLAVRWNEIEKLKGQYFWQWSETRIQPFLRAGFTPIITLFGSSKFYSAGGPPDEKSAPSDGEALDGFAKFAAATVERYGVSANGRPILYEIWNEANTKTFWQKPPDPEAYARMATAACRAIREKRPEAKILGLAMEGTPVKKPYFVLSYGIDIYQQWAARASTREMTQCVDGFSMHPYRPKPETYFTDEPALQAYVGAYWAKTPIIANTEWGYSIDPAKGRTDFDQATLTTQSLLLGAGMRRLVNIYQSTDTSSDPTKTESSYGLVTLDGRVKPAGAAVKRLMDAIGDYEVEGVGPLADGAYVFRARKDQQTANVVWRAEGPGLVELKSLGVTAGARTVNIVTGEERPLDGLALTISGQPVLITDAAP